MTIKYKSVKEFKKMISQPVFAGTEKGVKEPTATFSPCFGLPFMPLDPVVYGRILKEKINNPIIPRRGKIAISLYGFFIYSFLQILIKDVSILIDIDDGINNLDSDYKKYKKY